MEVALHLLYNISCGYIINFIGTHPSGISLGKRIHVGKITCLQVQWLIMLQHVYPDLNHAVRAAIVQDSFGFLQSSQDLFQNLGSVNTPKSETLTRVSLVTCMIYKRGLVVLFLSNLSDYVYWSIT